MKISAKRLAKLNECELIMSHSEALAEVTLSLEDDSEIYCILSRTSLNDQDLLFPEKFGPQKSNSTYPNSFLESLEKLKDLNINVDFSDDLDKDEDDNTALFKSPIVDFDPSFSDDVEVKEQFHLRIFYQTSSLKDL